MVCPTTPVPSTPFFICASLVARSISLIEHAQRSPHHRGSYPADAVAGAGRPRLRSSRHSAAGVSWPRQQLAVRPHQRAHRRPPSRAPARCGSDAPPGAAGPGSARRRSGRRRGRRCCGSRRRPRPGAPCPARSRSDTWWRSHGRPQSRWSRPSDSSAANTQCSMWNSGIGWCTTTSAQGARPPSRRAVGSSSASWAASRSNDGVNTSRPRASTSAAVSRLVTFSEKSPIASRSACDRRRASSSCSAPRPRTSSAGRAQTAQVAIDLLLARLADARRRQADEPRARGGQRAERVAGAGQLEDVEVDAVGARRQRRLAPAPGCGTARTGPAAAAGVAAGARPASSCW